ncbi:MAG: triphosphoribosyl-dephospho-CoA synthase [Xanthobacteraceae bacterium]
MTTLAERVAAAFSRACLDELEAPKPGNVHLFAPGHRMTAAEFVRSANAAAAPLAVPGARVGSRILGAVEATLAAVGTNTNLGIILLCAPLAAAAEVRSADLRAALAQVLEALDIHDAELAFGAIARAAPAGLGRAERHDVTETASVSLKVAMAEASSRDRIARQYVSDFEDIFERGEPVLTTVLASVAEPKWATLAVYLEFLSAFPDSHIARKHGIATAEDVCRAASRYYQRMRSLEKPAVLLADLLAWDALLKERGINPGTSADLTVATLFAHRLRTILPSARNND